MILYHVTDDIFNIIDIFEPRVPNLFSLSANENDYIPRICVAPSIENCLSAVPWGGNSFEENMCSPIEYVYKLIRVYEFEIDVEAEVNVGRILSPYTLKNNEWVRDAMVNNEYWLLHPAKPTKSYIINLIYHSIRDVPLYPADIQLNLDNNCNTYTDIELQNACQSLETIVVNTEYNIVEDNELLNEAITLYYKIQLEDNDYNYMIFDLNELCSCFQFFYTFDNNTNILSIEIPKGYGLFTKSNILALFQYILQEYEPIQLN